MECSLPSQHKVLGEMCKFELRGITVIECVFVHTVSCISYCSCKKDWEKKKKNNRKLKTKMQEG